MVGVHCLLRMPIPGYSKCSITSHTAASSTDLERTAIGLGVKHKADFRDALASASRTFSGDHGVMLAFGDREATDCGKAIVIRDPDTLMTYGLDEDTAAMTARASTTHESAHLRFNTDIVKFNDAIIKLVRLGADRDLAFRSINYAEDVRVDAAMSRERPGYYDQRMRSARVFIPLLYKRSELGIDMHCAMIATSLGIKLGWRFTAEQQERIAKAVSMLEECETAKTTEEAAAIGAKVYAVLHGEPTPKPEPPPPPPTEAPPWEASPEEEDDEDLDGEEADDTEPEEDTDAEPDDDTGSEEDGDGGEPAPREEPEPLDPETEKALGSWLESKADEVLSGDSIADGISDKSVRELTRRDAELARGSAKLADMQRKEQTRGDLVEHTLLSTDIEALYSKGVNAGAQIWYTKPKVIAGWALHTGSLARERVVPASVASLTQTFKDLLRKARERDSFLHKSGTVRADKVWRGTILGDGRVFTKHEEKGSGGYAVKLLLDASGSMAGSVGATAIVAYIVAKAMLQAGMKVAVEAFDAGGSSCCVYHHMLLPWDSAKVEQVLGYHAMHQNRDGYSIRAAYHELLQRPEQYKILIVLSDGSPYHAGVSEAIKLAGGIPGGGGAALNDDAAKAVREARTKGIKVLGIYFGDSGSTKDVEAYIYGKDFVHVQELDRVAPNIRLYLSRIIGV